MKKLLSNNHSLQFTVTPAASGPPVAEMQRTPLRAINIPVPRTSSPVVHAHSHNMLYTDCDGCKKNERRIEKLEGEIKKMKKNPP